MELPTMGCGVLAGVITKVADGITIESVLILVLVS